MGTALLLATVIGSGIMGDRLSGGNVAIALLANTLATGAVLVTLLLTFGPISGAHFNPAVTIADASQGGLPWRAVPAYVTAQVIGAFIGVAVAHLMFSEPVFSASLRDRSGAAQIFSEFVATFGLTRRASSSPNCWAWRPRRRSSAGSSHHSPETLPPSWSRIRRAASRRYSRLSWGPEIERFWR